jgi:hypothetical protein
MMNQGKVNGYLCQGFNPVASFPNKNKVVESLSKLKFLVTIDPLNTETSTFWQNHGESNDVDPSKIQTEVFRLPSPALRKRTALSSTPALAAVALERRGRPGHRHERRRDPGRYLLTPA